MSSSYSEEGLLQAGLGSSSSHHGGDDYGDAPLSSVQAFLDQCMEYHEQQEEERKQKRQAMIHQMQSTGEINSTNGFVDLSTSSTSQQQQQQHAAANPQHLLEQGTARAMAVLERLQHQQQQQQLHSLSDNYVATDLLHQECTPEQFRIQRQEGFAREAKRRRLATLRNFEYLTKQHDRSLQLLNHQIEQRRLVEDQVYASQQVAHQQRQERLRQDRLLGAKPRSTPGSSVQSPNGQPKFEKQSLEKTVALYISGFPTTTTTTTTTNDPTEQSPSTRRPDNDHAARSNTAMLTTLFAEFGILKKIHLYRNKQTGQLKGDGLVIYKWNDNTDLDRNEFVSKVCMQRNGLQFPNGSTLFVEPALSNDQQETSASHYGHLQAVAMPNAGNDSYYGPAPIASDGTGHVNDEPTTTFDQHQSGDDLDDFFASIE